jgi:hypothetical protein
VKDLGLFLLLHHHSVVFTNATASAFLSLINCGVGDDFTNFVMVYGCRIRRQRRSALLDRTDTRWLFASQI